MRVESVRAFVRVIVAGGGPSGVSTVACSQLRQSASVVDSVLDMVASMTLQADWCSLYAEESDQQTDRVPTETANRFCRAICGVCSLMHVFLQSVQTC